MPPKSPLKSVRRQRPPQARTLVSTAFDVMGGAPGAMKASTVASQVPASCLKSSCSGPGLGIGGSAAAGARTTGAAASVASRVRYSSRLHLMGGPPVFRTRFDTTLRRSRSSRERALKPRQQIELPEMGLLGPVERFHPVHLEHGEAEDVDPRDRSRAAREVARAAEDPRLGRAVPGDAGVEEGADLHRDRPVEILAAEEAEQRG